MHVHQGWYLTLPIPALDAQPQRALSLFWSGVRAFGCPAVWLAWAKYKWRMSEKHPARATITFFGEPRRTPEPGERVMLRVERKGQSARVRCVVP